MSTTIDQRVVEMQFDNRHFENNVATTMSSLDKLKQSLNFSGAAKSFGDIDDAARRVDMNGLGAAVETVRMKFSALQVMGVTALSNITNSAVNAGKRIVSALTIDPIKTGLNEYETQINAVQTILANTESKGTTLDDVNGALDTLNKYADKTIYNFTEMTRNIGTFTAAGVDLDTSVNAIQGIANLAAVSGSTSQQASTAMYQLSQALSSGTVKLMDWNSVVNAGMGGQVFQDALKETARVHGIAIDDMIKENGSFRETLQEGWLSADILTETLSKFTMATEGLTDAEIQANREKLKTLGYTDEQIEGIFKLGNTATNAATKVKTFTQLWDTLKETAQSGWTQTWELIFGDFEGAKSFFSDLYGTIAPLLEASANARNELLKGWNEAGGRNDLIDSLYNVIDAIGSVVKPIKEAFRDIFPPMTVDQLVSFTKGLKEFTASLKLSDETSDKLKRTFKGLFAVIDIVWQVFKGVGKAIGSLFGSVTGLSGGLLDITATFGDWLVALRDGISKSEIFSKALSGIVTAVKFVLDGLKGLLGLTGGAFSAFGSMVSSAFDSASKSVEECSLVKVLKSVWSVAKTIVSAIIDVFGNMARGIGRALGDGNFEGVLNIIKSIATGGIGVALIRFINGLKNSADGASGILENIGGIFENIGGVFGSLSDAINAFTAQTKSKALMNIAIAIGILAASLLVLSFIDSDKLYDSIVAIGALFAALMASLSFITKTEGPGNLVKISTLMISVSAAVLLLSFALKTIASLDVKSMIVGLAGVAGLMAMVVATVKALNGNSMTKGSVQIVIFAAAIKVLASACEDLSDLSWGELARGLVGVSVLMAGIAVFLRTAKFEGKALSTGLGILAIAAAIKILASACEDFGYMDWDEISKGLIAIGALLAEIAIFTNLTGDAKKLISTGIAMIAISAAMKIFASATKDMASMSWGSLVKGLLGMAGALTAVVIALKFMPKNIIGSGVGLIAVSAALLILAEALGRMGNMSTGGLVKSLVALCASLAALAIAFNVMKGTASGSAALIIAAGAIAILTPALERLGKMSWVSIAKGLITLAGAFTIIGIAGLLLKPIVPAILGLAGALALIGAGVLLVGAGVVAIGAGLTSIAAGIVALVAALSGSVTIIIDLIVSIIVGVAKGLAEAIIAICEIISRGLPSIMKAVKAIVVAVVQVLVECIPILVEGVLIFIAKLLESLIRVIPQIVDSLFDLLVAVLQGIAKRLPELIGAVVDIVVALIQGVIDALGNAKIEISLEDIINIGALTGVMIALAGLSALFPAAMAGVAKLGILIAELAVVLAAVGALAQIPGLTWLIDEGGAFLETIGTAIGRFVGGIVGGIAQGFTSSLPAVARDLSNFMYNLRPFIAGAKQIDESVVDGAKSMVGVILAITGAGVLERIASLITGGSSFISFASQLPILGRGIKKFADEVRGISAEDVKSAADAAKALARMTTAIPNEGGIVSWFTGENSISKWGAKLPTLGEGLKAFSKSVKGVNVEDVKSAADAAKAVAEMTATIPNEGGIVSWFAGENSVAVFSMEMVMLGKGLGKFSESAANIDAEKVAVAVDAAKSIADMSNTIPNEGGMVAWFTGDNNLAKFASQFPVLGRGLLALSVSVQGINADNVNAAVNAAKAIAEMSNIIPNEGGVVAWFTGDNSLANFAEQFPVLGRGILGFSNSVKGIIPDNVVAGAKAAKTIAEMSNTIPNEGGMVAWFTGDNTLANFADQLPALGEGLLSFSNSVKGIVPENVTAAANAAKTLAEMTNILPNEGGMVAWFTGEDSVARFKSDLIALGRGLTGFGESVADINPERITAGANAAKALVEIANAVPNEGGVVAWFAGENSLAKFAYQLPVLGRGLSGFSSAVSGINIDNVTNAINAAKTVADMTKTLPDEGGVKAWFVGDNSLANFASQLPKLGDGISGFSESVSGVNPEAITAAANAAKALAEMTKVIPSEGGVKAWFTGESSISSFADKLPALGEGLQSFSDSVAGVNPENITAASNAAKSLAQMSNTIPDKTDNLSKFGGNLEKFGTKLASYFVNTSAITAESIATTNEAITAIEKVSTLQTGNISAVSESINDISKSLKNLSKIPKDSTSKFKDALADLGKVSADELVKALEDIEDDTKKAGDSAMKAFIDGIKSQTKAAKAACVDIAKACVDALNSEVGAFYIAGKNLVDGFAGGISANTYKASAKAKAMADAALQAAKQTLDINSPSKVFREIGASVPEGFAEGITKFTGMVTKSSVNMADTAVGVVGESIASLANLVSNDVDAQPTIRPVLDLSDIHNKAKSINSMFGDSSVGVLANVGAISSTMNSKAQNGGNDDVVSAIKDLRKDFEKFKGDTYNFGNIAYNDDTEVQNAVHTLVRAVKIGKRV